MKTTTKIAVAAGLLITTVGLVGFGTWRYRISRGAAAAAQAVIVRDRSDSQLGGCDGVAGMTRELIDSFPFGTGSQVGLMITGDAATAGEPVLVVALDVPVSKRVTEGKGMVVERQQALVEKFKQGCRNAGQTSQSPVYLSIRRAVEYLRAHGCDGRNRCVVYVQSDLEELSEKGIRDYVDRSARTDARYRVSLPTQIDNSGIEVKICGLSETAGAAEVAGKRKTLTPQHDARRVDVLTDVWRQLFSDPSRVAFNSHCPKANE